MDPSTEAVVAAQLGRLPRGLQAVAHTCPCGQPDVVQTAPRLPDGTPFPTLYYLTCPRAAAAISRLEAAGLMKTMTARLADGVRGLFAVALVDPAVKALPTTWWNAGMAGSDTRPVQFTNSHAVAVGDPGDYLSRPGFWHGAIGVAACWLGGARRVAEPLYRCAATESADAYSLAHLGAVDSAIAAGDAILATAAAQTDSDPFDRANTAELLARRTRAIVEHAADEAITRTGRALGPGPLCQDGRHAQRVADLSIYIRQSHAERDLAALGRLAGRPR